jgi:hypothetical protein
MLQIRALGRLLGPTEHKELDGENYVMRISIACTVTEI